MPEAPNAPDLKTPLALGSHLAPGLWQRLLPEDLQFMRFPSECASTCDACPMVREENFHPDVRCCSYHPRIPNVLLGLALEDPETAPLIERLIAEGLATPEGLQATPAQMLQSLRRDGVVCRFLDAANRRCGIYRYRNSVCTTFFCKHDHGDAGYDMWRSLQAVVGQYEAALSQWAMSSLGFDVDAFMARLDELASDMTHLIASSATGWPDDLLRKVWGDWHGREAEFYRACATLVRGHDDAFEETLESWSIRSPKKYEQALLDGLPEPLKAEMLESSSLGGVPVPISTLWYQFKLALRNLWQP